MLCHNLIHLCEVTLLLIITLGIISAWLDDSDDVLLYKFDTAYVGSGWFPVGERRPGTEWSNLPVLLVPIACCLHVFGT